MGRKGGKEGGEEEGGRAYGQGLGLLHGLRKHRRFCHLLHLALEVRIRHLKKIERIRGRTDISA